MFLWMDVEQVRRKLSFTMFLSLAEWLEHHLHHLCLPNVWTELGITVFPYWATGKVRLYWWHCLSSVIRLCRPFHSGFLQIDGMIQMGLQVATFLFHFIHTEQNPGFHIEHTASTTKHPQLYSSCALIASHTALSSTLMFGMCTHCLLSTPI